MKLSFDAVLAELMRTDVSADDLRRLAIAYKVLQEQVNQRSARQLCKGQRVSWVGRVGYQSGVIIRVNAKTATITADSGMQWKVSHTLLKAL